MAKLSFTVGLDKDRVASREWWWIPARTANVNRGDRHALSYRINSNHYDRNGASA